MALIQEDIIIRAVAQWFECHNTIIPKTILPGDKAWTAMRDNIGALSGNICMIICCQLPVLLLLWGVHMGLSLVTLFVTDYLLLNCVPDGLMFDQFLINAIEITIFAVLCFVKWCVFNAFQYIKSPWKFQFIALAILSCDISYGNRWFYQYLFTL